MLRAPWAFPLPQEPLSQNKLLGKFRLDLKGFFPATFTLQPLAPQHTCARPTAPAPKLL